MIARETVTLPGGSVTFLRIRPPALPAPPPAPPPRAATAAELLEEARLAAKPHRVLALSTVVCAGSPAITELSWTRPADGRRFVAYGNVDFTHLGQLHSFETADAVYQWFPFVSEGEPGQIPADIRQTLAASGPEPLYLFAGTEADALAEADTLAALDHLHAYYQLHAAELIADTARRRAESAERERQAAIEAAKPRHETVHFWKLPAR